jgi:hypothetical protein
MFLGEIPMQPTPQESHISTSKKTDWIAAITLIVASIANVLATAAIILSVRTEVEKGNADLVRIGVSVLRVDPEKEKQLSEATREWALNLIDTNAGGVKFSPEARAQLLRQPLKYDGSYNSYYDTSTPDYDTSKRVKPAPRSPSPEAPK